MTENEQYASDVIDAFLVKVLPNKTPREQLEILVECWDVARLTAGALNFRGNGSAPYVDFWMTEFLFGSTVKDIYAELGVPDDAAAQCTLNAVRQFANVLQVSSEAATQDVLLGLIADAAVATLPPLLPPVSIKVAKPAPAIVSSVAFSRLFKPAKLTPNSGVTLVSWKSQLPTGLGPQLTGLLVAEGADNTTVLLETGEIHEISNSSFLLARTTDPADYEHAPIELLAYAAALACVQDNSPFENLGKFLSIVGFGYEVSFIEQLVKLFDNEMPEADVVLTGPFDGSPYRVRLEGGVSKIGPYVTAKLIDEQANVIMRLNTPRIFSPRGVYLFPMVASKTVYSLVVN